MLCHKEYQQKELDARRGTQCGTPCPVLASDGSWVARKHGFAAGGYIQGTYPGMLRNMCQSQKSICLISGVAGSGMITP